MRVKVMRTNNYAKFERSEPFERRVENTDNEDKGEVLRKRLEGRRILECPSRPLAA